MAPRPKFETQPKIDLRLLIRHGLFRNDVDRLGFHSARMSMVFYFMRSTSSLLVFFRDWGEVQVQEIAVGFANRRTGRTPYLLCPELKTRCEELHFHEGRFVSRRAVPGLSREKPPKVHRREVGYLRMCDRLLGTDGRPPARDEERATLIAAFRAVPFAQARWPQLRPIFEELMRTEYAQRRRSARSSRAQGFQSTRMAVLAGKDAGGDVDLTAYLSCTPEAWLATVHPVQEGLAQHPLALIEDYPALDIRWIAKASKPDSSGLWVRRVRWPKLEGVLIADSRDPDQPFLALRNLHLADGTPVPDQVIRLIPSAHGNRRYMQCPLSLARCEILFFRDIIFASSKAARLVHRSQRLRLARARARASR